MTDTHNTARGTGQGSTLVLASNHCTGNYTTPLQVPMSHCLAVFQWTGCGRVCPPALEPVRSFVLYTVLWIVLHWGAGVRVGRQDLPEPLLHGAGELPRPQPRQRPHKEALRPLWPARPERSEKLYLQVAVARRLQRGGAARSRAAAAFCSGRPVNIDTAKHPAGLKIERLSNRFPLTLQCLGVFAIDI